MELEITHPNNSRCRFRIRVSSVFVDRPDLLVVSLADVVVHHANRQLALHRGKKVTLTDLMERTGPCRFQLHNPEQNHYVRVVSRPKPNTLQKTQKALRFPGRSLQDPVQAAFVARIMASTQRKD